MFSSTWRRGKYTSLCFHMIVGGKLEGEEEEEGRGGEERRRGGTRERGRLGDVRCKEQYIDSPSSRSQTDRLKRKCRSVYIF